MSRRFSRALTASLVAVGLGFSGAAAPVALAGGSAPASVQAGPVIVQEGWLTSTDGKGTPIWWRSQTIPSARGTVVLVHGWGEHSGRYDHVAQRLLDAGYNVYRLDHRGHGKSARVATPVPAQHMDDFHFLVDDVHQLVTKAKQETGVPTFLLGHSMGALASQFFGIKYPGEVAGIVTNGGGAPLNLSGNNAPAGRVVTPEMITEAQRQIQPSLFDQLPMNEVTTFNARLAQELIPGRTDLHVPSADWTSQVNLPNPLADQVASDPAVLAAYKADPLMNKGIGLGQTQQVVFSAIYDSLNADLFREPTLMMHGTKDKLVPVFFARNWYNGISSQDKELVYWQDQMHEVLNDPVGGEAMDTVVNWLNART